MSKPPLDLDVEVEDANGTTYRLGSTSAKAKDRIQGVNFSTLRGSGFDVGSATLNRQIFKDYPDIGLMDNWRFVGRQGDIAYEGRLHSNPRTNNPQETINVALVGWSSYLQSRRIAPLIIDCRLSGWGEPSLNRRTNLITSSFALSANAGTGFQDASGYAAGILIDFSPVTFVAGFTEGNEMTYYAGGEDIGFLYYDQVGDATTPWSKFAVLSNDDVQTEQDISANYSGTAESKEQALTASLSGRKYAFFMAYYTGTFEGRGGNKQIYNNIKVVGRHGLERTGSWPEVGYRLSDIVEYVLNTYYPKIDTSEIQSNTYPVQQATWHDNPTDGHTLIQELNNYALWETNIWEERKFHFEPADLSTYDWQIRTTDPGVEVNFEGQSIEDFANGCAVTYTDFYGVKRVLYPSEYEELRDESDDNAANKHSENLWVDVEVPWPTTQEDAIQFGRIYLAEFNRPKRPGTYTIAGHIRDGSGQWQQGWKVRNGQTIGIMDHPADEPRLIVATGWDADSQTLQVTVDAPSKYLDAIVARQENARTAAGR